MKKLTILSLFTLFLLQSGAVLAAATDSHDLTVTVSAINELAIAGGNISLDVNTATTAGADPDAVTDASTSLDWTTNELTRKITVKMGTDTSGDYTLKVTAAKDTGAGTAAGQLTLTLTDQDIMTAFGEELGGAGLTYEVSATAAQGTFTAAANTVTYTLTAGI